jgi:hypothetical protein
MTDEELKVLVDLVYQHCGEDRKDTGEILIHSMAISADAAAMRLLAQYGLMEIDSEIGRSIHARWTTKGHEFNEHRPSKRDFTRKAKWQDFPGGE